MKTWIITVAIIAILLIGGIFVSAVQPRLTSNAIINKSETDTTNTVQEINMDISESGYSPSSFVLKKGIPVKWNINVKQLTACNDEIILNSYGIKKSLKEGLNVIEFTPDKTGTISFSCSMGMLRGSFIVTESGTATKEQIQSNIPARGNSCSMGSNGRGCGCGMT